MRLCWQTAGLLILQYWYCSQYYRRYFLSIGASIADTFRLQYHRKYRRYFCSNFKPILDANTFCWHLSHTLVKQPSWSNGICSQLLWWQRTLGSPSPIVYVSHLRLLSSQFFSFVQWKVLERFDKVSSTVSHPIAYLILEAFCMLNYFSLDFCTTDAF